MESYGELKDVKELLHHDYLAKDEAPKAAPTKVWGKPAQSTQPQQPVKSLLEIEEEQMKEKEKQDELNASKQKPGMYQAKHGQPSSTPTGSKPGSYHRPERTDAGPTTSFEAYSREHRPRQQVPVPNHPPFTAYVGNLPFNITEEQLAEYFDGLDVKDIRLVKLSDGRSKGFAFVEFESADGLTQSLQANGQPFHNRNLTVEVQPPRGEGRSFGGGGGGGGFDDDKSRWGPASGSGPASSLGAQAREREQNRPQYGQREGGSFGERKPYQTGSRDYEPDDRQWRGKGDPAPIPQRPKIDLKPRTLPTESRPVDRSEDPFGGLSDTDKQKRQSEIQAQREAEIQARHAQSSQPPSQPKQERWGNKQDNFSRADQGGRDGWRANPNNKQEHQQQPEHHSGGEKYRFNKGNSNEPRSPSNRSNYQKDNHENRSGSTGNTFEALSTGSSNKW